MLFMIYTENKAIKLTLKHGHPRMCRLIATEYIATYSKGSECNWYPIDPISGFQLISLDKHDKHVASTVEVRKTLSQSTRHGIANRQQVHVILKYIINMLNWKATFVKILLIKITDYSICQNFAPSNICAIQYTLNNMHINLYGYVQVTVNLFCH